MNRFDEGLELMVARSRQKAAESPEKSPEQRRNECLAERIASALNNLDYAPNHWKACHHIVLVAVNEFFADHPEVL